MLQSPERVGLPSGPASGRAPLVGRSRPEALVVSHLASPVHSQSSTHISPRTVTTATYPPDDPTSPGSSSTLQSRMVSRYRAYPDNDTQVQDKKVAQKMNFHSDAVPGHGYGQSLWESVQAAAGSLTINVAHAWDTKTPTNSGEVTPLGHESHLLSVMKAYHLGKARNPSELPEWLFDESELWTISRSRLSDSSNTTQSTTHSSRSPALQELYNAVAEEQKIDGMRQSSGSMRRGPSTGSKAADRLRAMREARRNNMFKDEPDAADAGDVVNESTQKERTRPIGLPSRPGRIQ